MSSVFPAQSRVRVYSFENPRRLPKALLIQVLDYPISSMGSDLSLWGFNHPPEVANPNDSW